MKVSKELTNTVTSTTLLTPKECNGVHILWSVVDTTTGLLADATGISVSFFALGPAGNEIPFDVNPVAASGGQVKPTAMGPSINLKATASGLTAQKKIVMSFHFLF